MWSWKSDVVVLKEIGQRIKKERLDANLTQEELAEQSGVGLATLRRLEKGASVSMRQFLMLLRMLRMLDRLEMAFPEKEISPIQLLELKGKERKRVRKSKK